MTGRITVTPRAAEAVRGLGAAHGPLVFHLSGGCCDGSSPMCLLAAELPRGPSDSLLGEIAGAPFYVDADQDRRWGQPRLLVDILPGAATSLSLEGSQDRHFVVSTPSDDAAEGAT